MKSVGLGLEKKIKSWSQEKSWSWKSLVYIAVVNTDDKLQSLNYNCKVC